jgi:maltokinase
MNFEYTLACWLPRQRWFSGRNEPSGELSITAECTLLAGDPELRHLIVTLPGGEGTATYQILVGARAELPPGLSHATIGPLPDGRTAYDALHDPELARFLVECIAAERTVGALRFAREAGARLGDWPDSRVLTAEQSNTSVVFGESAILKLLRRVFPGVNPDLEVAGALARLGSRRIAPPFGTVRTQCDGQPVLLAVLSEYLAHATDGWSLAAADLGRLYPPNGGFEQDYLTAPLPPGPEPAACQATGAASFAEEARRLGGATAELHADLASAFGTRQMPPGELTGLAEAMTARLDRAGAEVGELARHDSKVRSAYADLARAAGPVPVQRIHGDYHLGQVLRTLAGWVALDFEGEPAVPLAQRRAPAPALRDVAGMLRSFDYAARHRLLGHPDEARLRRPADDWVQRCQAAFCAGYAQAGGMDPERNSALLRALMLDKAVYEVVYESRHRPAWLPIPLDSIAAA